MTKMTQRDYFNEVIALAEANGRDDLVKFAQERIAVLNKKAENKKATKTQEENEGIKVEIKNVLAQAGVGMTVTEIQNASEVLAQYQNQKLSALLRQLVLAEEVVKTIDKKKSYFSVPVV